MSSNLKGLALLLVAISLVAWWARPVPHVWEASWNSRLSLQLFQDHREKLVIHQDAYQVLVGSGRGALVSEKGMVRLNGARLELHSQQGRVSSWRVESTDRYVVLRNDDKFYYGCLNTERGMRGRLR